MKCLPKAFAKAFGITENHLYTLIGHDGTRVINNNPEPFCFQMIHIQEIIDVALYLGLTITEIQAEPKGAHADGTLINLEVPENRMQNYLSRYTGVVACTLRGLPHAEYWDNTNTFENIGIFWIVK